MVSVMGGKWTTYRRMAQDTIEKILEENPGLRYSCLPSRSKDIQLIGADRAKVVCSQQFDKICVTLRESYGMDKIVASHLMTNYGTRALQIAEVAQQGFQKRLCSKY